MTKISVATTKRYKDSDGNWQQKTQWHSCVAYGPAADYAAKIQTGAHVFIEGEIVYREYACRRTDWSASSPLATIQASSPMSLPAYDPHSRQTVPGRF